MGYLCPWTFKEDAGLWAVIFKANTRTQLDDGRSCRIAIVVKDLHGHADQTFANSSHGVVVITVIAMINSRILGDRDRTRA